LYAEQDDIANRVYILDLANPWQPDSSITPQAKIDVMTDTGLVSQTFSLSYDSTISLTITPVDSDTVPSAFVFVNPTAVQSFLDSAAAASSASQPETTSEITFAITQSDCTAPSGKYVSHGRYKDGSTLTYVDSVFMQYTASATAPLVCNQGEIEILE